LQVVTDRLGLTADDVLAIGDGDNDVEMLRWAGRGVAMGQAPVAVQEVADDVTETIDNDGAAREIARYL
ncbi:MAG TPA: HAD hydrolase family protein, partial [Nocardioidaceae bacterium]|nr:HAD hydrolase family protein [Nocardioidaceae bacterium]